jgi:thioesterase domain-containing protein/acyl carrier protein
VAPLSDRRQSLLRQYLRRELSQDATPKGIPKRPHGEPLSASFGQEQLWFLTQLAPDAPVCNEALTIRRTGPLDVEALERSLTEIIRRHEVWRTSCTTRDGQLLQVIEVPPTWKLPLVDFSDLPHDEKEARALDLAEEDARRPFALNGEPLLRTTLVRLGPMDHRLFVTVHQFVIDCTSIYQVMFPELTALYEAYSTGRPSPLRELPIQYADFSSWQRQQLKEGDPVAQVAYWRERLGGSVTELRLPTDRPPSPRRTFRGTMHPFRMPERLNAALRALSYQERVTPFMTLLASFDVLLYLYTGQDDLIVGTATAGRKRRELDPLMGYFLNYLVLRTDLSDNPSFRDLLKRVRDVTLGALTNDDIPFDHLVRELHPARHSSRNPLFQVAFTHAPGLSMAYASAASTNTIEPGWNLTQLDVDVGTSKFDLSVDIDDGPEFVAGRLFYSTDLFDAATITRMVGHWEILLEGLVADPDQRLSDLSLLTPPVLSPKIIPTDGVLDRHQAAGSTEQPTRTEPSDAAPRDELERQLTAIWERALGVQPIGIGENFFELGGDSLLAIRVFYQIEKTLGKHLPLATLFEAPTIEELASVLRQEHWSPRWTSLVEIQASGSKPPFFCVHGHGGHVLLFYNLARQLGPDQPFYGIQAVGLDGREPPYTRFEDMARHYIDEMRSVQPTGPYFIGGYCLGGPVAYELARQLREQGDSVALLVMFDSFRPGYPKLKRFMPPPVFDALHRLRILAFHFTTTLRLGVGKGTAYLVETAQRGLAGTAGRLLGRVEPLAMTKTALMEAYLAYDAAPYPGRVILLRATRLPLGIQDAPSMGWAGFAEAGLEIEEMPLYYTTELSGRNVEILAERLKARIDEGIEQLDEVQRIASAAV